MHQQVGTLKADEQGLALRGVLVRHLVRPGLLEDTRQIMNYLARELSTDTYVNVMDQYYPAWHVIREEKYTEIRRRIWPEELHQAYQYAREASL